MKQLAGTIANVLPRRPSDRVYSAIGWSCLVLVAGIVLYGGLVAPYVSTPRVVGFRMVVGLILLFNVLWWSIADRRFARFVRGSRRSRYLRIVLAGSCLALNAPILMLEFAGRRPQYLAHGPEWYAGAVMIWHLGLATLMPIVAIVRLSWLAARGTWRRMRANSAVAVPPESSTEIVVDPMRRAILHTGVATAPMILLGGATAAARWQRGSITLRRHQLAAPWLPDRLRGLTITHLSDLHVGAQTRPSMLPRIVELTNSLDSDLLLITGDIVDMSNEMLPPALDAIGQLTHRYGRFICIGNHDAIDDRPEFIRITRERFPLLIDERRRIEIGGERVCVGGLDFTRSDEATDRRPGHADHVAALLRGYEAEREGPMIAMAHHPHAFDALAEAGVPLTLSGHTHGGQLMLTNPQASLEIGAGNLLFRYLRGFYECGGHSLFVNSGAGNWFPLRINAPAEIVQIQLV